MSWWKKLWAWLVALFQALANTTPSGAWSINGNTVVGTITGGLINTNLPITDQNTTPRHWVVSPDKTSFSTTL